MISKVHSGDFDFIRGVAGRFKAEIQTQTPGHSTESATAPPIILSLYLCSVIDVRSRSRSCAGRLAR